MHFETRAIHAGQEPDPATGAVTTPIYQTSTFAQEAVGVHKGYDYARVANPTRTALLEGLQADRGALAILEFCEPAAGPLGDIYRFYCQRVLPKIGGLISGDADAYAYLPKSVSRFFRPDELAGLMKQVGYTQVRYHLMTLN